MKLSEKIRLKINKLPKGITFGYTDLDIEKKDYLSVAKVLERLQKKEIIKKLSKGKFYKPEQTVFGELKPDRADQLKQYLFKNGKRIAYVTGSSLYNQLGLTRQLAFRIKIASRSSRISINRGSLKADAVKSYAEVTEKNYHLLGFLDALKDIKKIPDSNVGVSVKILSSKIEKLNESKQKELIKYALLYPPRVRALLGAILENLDNSISSKELKNSLNPLSKYRLGLKKTDLPTIDNWYIE